MNPPDKWEELKEYIIRQHQIAMKIGDGGSPAQRLLVGFWKQIKDKMWSIEKHSGGEK